ncbi:MAG TPA: hypothetical protein VK756_05035 [Solirubrobacteraceae bacterium]|jgi:hypothetical protein|nr:hypothetical protein [Solirubrobacteraceae bacterium]
MKTIKTLLVAFTAVLALVAVSSTVASAHTWKQEGKVLKSAVKFHSTQELKFSEVKTGFELECAVVEEGTVGPGAAGEITSAKARECHSIRGCESADSMEVEAYSGLPWKTELVTLYEGLRNQITSTGAEWKIHCTVLESNWLNYCQATSSMAIENAKTSAEEVYDGKAPYGNCVNGPAGDFNTLGGGLLKNSVGEAFQAE